MNSRPRTRLAALLALPLAAAVLVGCGTEEPEATDPVATDSPSATDPATPPSTETTTSSTEPSPTDSPDGGGATVAVPVYFLGDTPQGPRLFSELREVPAADPLGEAVSLAVSGDALDPDYGTAFPEGGFASVAAGADGVDVEALDDGWSARTPGMTAQQAKLAVQSLVYTVQGVQQAEVPVRVTLGGQPVPLFGADSSTGLRKAGQNAVLALVNVTAPAEGATVSGSLTASGLANSFEATVPWEVRDGSGAVVLEGFATAEGWIDRLYPWQSAVDLSTLAPGTYTFAARTDDPSDGEGRGPTEDTKTITVQ